MPALLSRIGMLILIALLLSALPAAAQDDDTLTVVGSGIVTPLIEALAASADTALTTNITGTNAGFSAFCNNDADIIAAVRPMSAAEQAACESGGVNFVELLLAHEIIAVIGHAESEFGQCLPQFALNALFAPSATATNWRDVSPENDDIALTVYIPALDSTTYALLDALVDGIGTRADALTTDASMVETVSSTPGAIGVVDLTEAQAAGDAVTIFQLNTNAAGCTEPSAETVEARSYDAAYRLFAYINVDALTSAQPIFGALYDDNAIVDARGLTALTEDARTAAQAALTGEETGRQFSLDVVAFTIPQNLSGALNIAGAATGAPYVEAITGSFVELYPTVTVTFNPDGEPASIRRFCNGEVELITSVTGLNDEQSENCTANNVTPITVPLGSEAMVLIANEASEYLTCVTTETLGTVWGASAEPFTTWDQVNAEFPEQDIILFAPTIGSPTLDALVLTTAGAGAISRADLEQNDDPLFRAAATANVEGALALLTWSEYQAVVSAGQERLQVVEIDAGAGCVAPTLDTISDGTYPLARQVNLLVNEVALGRSEVQSLVWFMFSDENYPLFAATGLISTPFAALPELRAELESTFASAAEAAAAAVLAEVTAESTPEAETTDEPEATQDATPEATAEATPETEG